MSLQSSISDFVASGRNRPYRAILLICALPAFNDHCSWDMAYSVLPSYLAPFLFYTRNINTGEISPLGVSDSFGVAVYVCSSKIFYHLLTSRDRNFKITLENATLIFNGLKDNIQFFLRIERSMATKVFVIMVGVTNCKFARSMSSRKISKVL